MFLATPADASMQLAPELLGAGAKVIDLSGAFRLGTAQNFERWYHEPHTQPGLLPEEAAYGLPEFCRGRVASARLIANPGCYPTAANLALRPLINAGVIAREAGIVCDAKSGVSGAGRKPSLKTSFCEVTGNFSTYAILEHRHVPEILRTSRTRRGRAKFHRATDPLSTGEFSRRFTSGLKDIQSADDLLEIYQRQYREEPFVRLLCSSRDRCLIFSRWHAQIFATSGFSMTRRRCAGRDRRGDR